MASDDCIYVVDSSSWVLIQQHPSINRILDALTSLIEQGRLKSPPEVFTELKSIDAVTGWLKTNKREILENRNSDISYLLRVGEVTAAFPGMVAIRGRREKADPYVVALASMGSENPGSWTVVCDETVAKRPNRKIPTACRAFGIDAIGLLEMLKKEFPDDEW